MFQVFSNDFKVYVTTFNVEDQLYKRISYNLKDKLNYILTTDNNDNFISFRYLPILNLPVLKDYIKNKTNITFTLISEDLDMSGIPISINNNILLVQQENNHNEYDINSILLRSEHKSDYEEFLNSLHN